MSTNFVRNEKASLLYRRAISRLRLFRQISALPDKNLDEIIFALHVPAGQIPTREASNAARTSALLTWCESPVGPGLALLVILLADIMSKAC